MKDIEMVGYHPYKNSLGEYWDKRVVGEKSLGQ